MKILIIPSRYPNTQEMLMDPNYQEYCSSLASRDDVDVNMLYVEKHSLKEIFKYIFRPKRKIIEEKGYKTYIIRMLDISKISFKLQMVSYTHKVKKGFKWYLKHEEAPMIIHTQEMLPMGYAACILKEKYHIPVLISEQNPNYKQYFKGKNQPYTRRVLINAHFVTASYRMQKEISTYGVKCDLLPNIINTQTFAIKSKKHEGLNLVAVCSINEIKDIIEATKLLAGKIKNKPIKLTIIGDVLPKGSQNELQLEDNVCFINVQTKEKYADILSKSDILLTNSEIEFFEVSALIMGIPVITTTKNSKVIDETWGKVLPDSNPKYLAQAINDVYKNKNKYDFEQLNKIIDTYIPNITDKSLEIYNGLK